MAKPGARRAAAWKSAIFGSCDGSVEQGAELAQAQTETSEQIEAAEQHKQDPAHVAWDRKHDGGNSAAAAKSICDSVIGYSLQRDMPS